MNGLIAELPANSHPTRPRRRGATRAGNRSCSMLVLAGLAACLLGTAREADADWLSGGSRLLATGGAMTVEGAAGGGIVPWSMIAGYAEGRDVGGAAFVTGAHSDEFDFVAGGAALGLFNRVELSVGKQQLDIDTVIPGEKLEQTIIGVKARLFGDIVYTTMPQVSLGVQYKKNDDFTVPEAVGARDDAGVDVYLSASKLWLAGPFDRSGFLNFTLRHTRANQLGLLGFGGDRRDDARVLAEASAGLFLNRHFVIGAEVRQKPDNLGFADENLWMDVFAGWFPSKRVAVVAAWADLGSIAGFNNQEAAYLSLQISH